MDEFDNTCLVSTIFSDHFIETSTQQTTTYEDVFAVLEDLIIFSRERALRLGDRHIHPVERQILNWFETCGLWTRLDSTLVADYYYVRIPIAVISELTQQGTPSCNQRDCPFLQTQQNTSKSK